MGDLTPNNARSVDHKLVLIWISSLEFQISDVFFSVVKLKSFPHAGVTNLSCENRDEET